MGKNPVQHWEIMGATAAPSDVLRQGVRLGAAGQFRDPAGHVLGLSELVTPPAE